MYHHNVKSVVIHLLTCLQAGDITPELIPEIRLPVHWMGKASCARDESVWQQTSDGFVSVPVQLTDR